MAFVLEGWRNMEIVLKSGALKLGFFVFFSFLLFLPILESAPNAYGKGRIYFNVPEEVTPKRFEIRNTSDTMLWRFEETGKFYFDANDYIFFNRTSDEFNFYVNDALAFCINESGGFNGSC